MNEIEAAIGREHLRKLDRLLSERRDNVKYLEQSLKAIPCIEPAKTRSDVLHSFYVHPIKYKADVGGVSRNNFVEAIKAELTPSRLREDEGVKIGAGYVNPLYLLPMFKNKVVYGKIGKKYKGFTYPAPIF